MAKPEDLEKIVLALPGVEKAARSTSFRVATYKLAGKGFAALEKRGGATFALDAADAQKYINEEPDVFEPITKAGQLIAVRADISQLALRELRKLVAISWLHKAPPNLTANQQVCSRGHVFTKSIETPACPVCWPKRH